ncbi:hypothetical protein Q3G72_018346 [Acer saccharum]|nr:hypothetical protein Q3G72_018346 [Acer saccharum]
MPESSFTAPLPGSNIMSMVPPKEIDEERVYIFLVRLDDIYDRIQSDILRTETFPNSEFAFATVWGEEHHRNIMFDQNSSSHVVMMAKNYRSSLT